MTRVNSITNVSTYISLDIICAHVHAFSQEEGQGNLGSQTTNGHGSVPDSGGTECNVTVIESTDS